MPTNPYGVLGALCISWLSGSVVEDSIPSFGVFTGRLDDRALEFLLENLAYVNLRDRHGAPEGFFRHLVVLSSSSCLAQNTCKVRLRKICVLRISECQKERGKNLETLSSVHHSVPVGGEMSVNLTGPLLLPTEPPAPSNSVLQFSFFSFF